MNVEVNGHLAVEEIGIHTYVNTFAGIGDSKYALGWATIVGVDKELIVLPEFCPSVNTELIAPIAVQYFAIFCGV